MTRVLHVGMVAAGIALLVGEARLGAQRTGVPPVRKFQLRPDPLAR
jgi:hypothetical protein